MTIPVLLPKLGTSADQVVLLRWSVAVGALVQPGDPLAEVETDKANVELVAPEVGYIRKLVAQPGATVNVGDLVAIMTARPDEPIDTGAPTGETPAIEAPVIEPPPAVPEPLQGALSTGRLRISPAARKLARLAGVDPNRVHGTGPGGRIVMGDIEAAAHVSAPAPAGSFVPLSRIKTAIARRMTQSAQSVPQFAVACDADVTELMQLRNLLNGNLTSGRLSFLDFVVQAVARALRSHPEVNASFHGSPESSDAGILLHDEVNIGLATATDAGLLVPVLRQADKLSLVQLAAGRRVIVQRAMNGRLQPGDVGGTFTISNLGPYGVDSFTAMVNPPEAGILAIGRVGERPAVVDGQIQIRSMVTLSLTVDHRVLDGAAAATFLKQVAQTLSVPTGWELVW